MNTKSQEIIEALRNQRSYIISAFLILIILLLIGILSQAGTRIMDTVGLVNTGTVHINAPTNNTQVFINNERYGVLQENELRSYKNLPVGKYTILISAPDRWPWQKTFSLHADQKKELRPFLLPRNPTQRRIPESSDIYYERALQVHVKDQPRKDNPVLSPNKKIAVWVEDKSIEAQWLGEKGNQPSFFCPTETCQDTITITPAYAPVKDIVFYNNRNDVLIVSADTGIFGLELNPTDSMQNFHPIYEGDDPHISLLQPTQIAVLDNSDLIILSL